MDAQLVLQWIKYLLLHAGQALNDGWESFSVGTQVRGPKLLCPGRLAEM